MPLNIQKLIFNNSGYKQYENNAFLLLKSICDEESFYVCKTIF